MTLYRDSCDCVSLLLLYLIVQGRVACLHASMFNLACSNCDLVYFLSSKAHKPRSQFVHVRSCAASGHQERVLDDEALLESSFKLQENCTLDFQFNY